MKDATINGRPAGEVFDALRGEIPGVVKHTDDKGYPYLAMDILQEFFEELVPPKNYDFTCGDTTTQLLEGGGGFISCSGTITICDDEGNPLRKRSYVGAANLAVSTTTGKVVDPAAATRSAVTNCKKGCMLGFGCGEQQLKDQKKDRRGGGSPAPKAADAKNEVFFVQKVEGKVMSGDKYILVPVRTSTGIKTRVLIWRSEFSNADKIADYISAGNEVALEGKFERYKDSDRIVFKTFKNVGARA